MGQFTGAASGGGGRGVGARDGAAEALLRITDARATIVAAQPKTFFAALFGTLPAMHLVIKDAA